MYHMVFLGGTFDRLHRGHAAVLQAAFSHGEKVVIGLTSDEFVRKFKKTPDQDHTRHQLYDDRKLLLENWLRKNKFTDRVEIVPLDDPHEPAASAAYDALIVTPDNRKRGEEINKRRKARNLPPVVLIEVALVVAADGQPISATRVRNGQIDADGWLVMPIALRPELQMPLGPVLVGEEISQSLIKHQNQLIISVGDMTTKILLDHGVCPHLAVIDGLVGRQIYPDAQIQLRQKNQVAGGGANFTGEAKFLQVASGPGYISKSAIGLIRKWSKLQSKQNEFRPGGTSFVIEVFGEEDLLTLPVIFYSPAGTVVYYGQPALGGHSGGLVEVVVDKKMQLRAGKLLKKFSSTY